MQEMLQVCGLEIFVASQRKLAAVMQGDLGTTQLQASTKEIIDFSSNSHGYVRFKNKNGRNSEVDKRIWESPGSAKTNGRWGQ